MAVSQFSEQSDARSAVFFKKNSIFILLGLILAVGVIGSGWIIEDADRQVRADLLEKTRLVTQALNTENILALSGTDADLASPDYQHIKNILSAMRAANPNYRFIYLLGRKSDGRIFFFVDSEKADSPDYSAPGEIYTEATDEDRRVFDTGTAVLEGPSSDRWGTWVSALEPLIDPASGKITAVAGMDIAAADWIWKVAARAALPVGMLLALLLLGFTYIRLVRRGKLIQGQQTKLLENEMQFRSMFLEHSAVMLLVEPISGRILDANSAASQFYGYSTEKLKSMTVDEINILQPDQVALERARALQAEKNLFIFLHKLASGEIRDVEAYSTPIASGGQTVLFSIIHDITERKQAEASLVVSQQAYRQLVERVPEVVYTGEIGGGWQYLSPNIQALCGYSDQELLSDPTLWISTIQIEDRVQLLAQIQSLSVGDILNAEYRILTRDRGVIWVRDHGIIKEDSLTGKKLIQGLLADITQQKEVEEALRGSESKMRAITDSARDAILMMDPEGRISYWNPAAEQILGYTNAEAIGKKLLDFIVPQRYHEAHIAVFPVFEKTGQGGAIGKSLEWEATRKDGTEIPIQLSLSSLSLNGKWYAVAIISDITERKQAVETLRESAVRFQSLFDESPISLWEENFSTVKQRLDDLRAQGVNDFSAYLTQHPEIVAECAALVKVMHVNQATLNLFKAANKEEVLKNLTAIFSDEGQDQFRNEFVLIASGATHFEMEMILRTLDGDLIVVNMFWSVISGYEKDLSKVIVSIIDITQRKQAEENLKKSELQFRSLFE